NLDFADVRAVMRGMGKAMMGTGEASGDDRARHAAEAAIANPLLDDVSMHGARGLLISITGGPDLTLYEVDEAASRIREEVDSDANIILGATYDPDMTGTIRVSVVATGTDATMVQALEPVQTSTNPNRAPLAVKRAEASADEQRAMPPVQTLPAFETQVQQAVAEAIQHEQSTAHYEDDGVTVEPYIPAADHAPMDDIPPLLQDEPIPSVYVPSSAERPVGQRRMPRTEEFSPVAGRQLNVQEKQDPEPRNARALFKRLASNVGLGLRSNEAPPAREPVRQPLDDAAARSAIEAGASRVSHAPHPSEGARGNLDQHGRQAAPGGPREHIEIPAFLRKHG
ncbi:MAG TPA: cell division protein FtsZ, partial [Devosia sp.]|nr:cell division protein FtsZ [Devosia sp.]